MAMMGDAVVASVEDDVVDARDVEDVEDIFRRGRAFGGGAFDAREDDGEGEGGDDAVVVARGRAARPAVVGVRRGDAREKDEEDVNE